MCSHSMRLQRPWPSQRPMRLRPYSKHSPKGLKRPQPCLRRKQRKSLPSSRRTRLLKRP